MPDNNRNDDLIEAEFLRSLRQLESPGEKSSKKEETKESFDPIDAHEYVDPEKRHPEVYDKMVSEIERKRAERKKSIWSDEPVVPVKKSVWLDNDDSPAPRRNRRAEEGSGLKKTEFDIKLSEGTRSRMRERSREEYRAPAEEAPRRRVRPEGEAPRRRAPEEGERRRRPEGEEPVRRRQRPAEEQASSRVRQRPAEEQVSSRVRQRPAEEQASSRVRQNAETLGKGTGLDTANRFWQGDLCRKRTERFFADFYNGGG